MDRRRRSDALVQGDREARNIATTLGREVRTARRRLRWTQRELGQRVGLEQSRISEIERGLCDRHAAHRVGSARHGPRAAVGMAFARDLRPQPNDAGHLDAQEALLRICARTTRTVASSSPRVLPTRCARPISRSVTTSLASCRSWRSGTASTMWAAVPARPTARWRRPSALAIAIGHGRPYRVAWCWVLVDNAANRALVARYPRGPPCAVSRVVVGVGPGAHRRDARATPAGPRVDRPADRPALGGAASRAGPVAVGPLAAAYGSHRYGGHGSSRPPWGA